MQYKKLINSALAQWNFTRSETLELLKSLDDVSLQFKPEGPKWKTLAGQFCCLCSTQTTYTRSIKEGKLEFSWFREETAKISEITSKKDLLKALETSNNSWEKAIKNVTNEDFKIKWPGFSLSLLNTVTTLISHERLHHGQIIAYFTLADFELPPGFKNNWAL